LSQKIQRHLYTFPAPIRSSQPVRERPPYPIIRAYWNITVTCISSIRQVLREKLNDSVNSPSYHWLHLNEPLVRLHPKRSDFCKVTADAVEYGIRVNIKGRISTIRSPYRIFKMKRNGYMNLIRTNQFDKRQEIHHTYADR